MKPLVRDLYKRFLIAGRFYPQGLDYVRLKAKDAFFENAHLKDPVEIKKSEDNEQKLVKQVDKLEKILATKKAKGCNDGKNKLAGSTGYGVPQDRSYERSLR